MARMAIIVWILECKNVCWVYEQPHSSLLFEHPKMRDLVKMRRVFRAFTWMGSFGARSPKGTHLWAPTPLVHRFSMPLPTDVTWATDLVKKEVTKDGKVRVTGDKALKKIPKLHPNFRVCYIGSLEGMERLANLDYARSQQAQNRGCLKMAGGHLGGRVSISFAGLSSRTTIGVGNVSTKTVGARLITRCISVLLTLCLWLLPLLTNSEDGANSNAKDVSMTRSPCVTLLLLNL